MTASQWKAEIGFQQDLDIINIIIIAIPNRDNHLFGNDRDHH
jgi:hypothetical protein